jgi:asparagine synthase (glutamine-hydrolysing)
MFAALLNFASGPVALHCLAVDLPQRALVKALGSSHQAVLLHLPSEATRNNPNEERGITSLGERLWIVGRIRLDRRQELRAKLHPQAAADGGDVSDADLCLLAYAAWGDRCLDSLAGDFSFVLWDEERQRLFAARDQIGVRSLFHARAGTHGLIADSLDWIASRASLGRTLDDYWVADFLTLGFCREFERTVYRDVQRLPPAHSLAWTSAGAAVRRYWRLDIPEPIYLTKRDAYTERFRELVSRAIADRLPAGKVGIAMSGGLDSTGLAACTVDVTGDPTRVLAYCEHYEELMHIEEARFATLAARHLGIELRVERFDDAVYDPGWMSRGGRLAEPTRIATSTHLLRGIYADLARQSTVWFEGEGPDNALALDRNAYLSWLLGHRQWRRLAQAMVDYILVKGLPGWRQTVRRHVGLDRESNCAAVDLPVWLNGDFVTRLRLGERSRDLGYGGDRSHAWHPAAMANLTSPIWQSFFAECEIYESLGPMSWRHPYLDLRVLQFMLSVPPIPWAWKKQLMRQAMAGRLPEPVLRRPKTALPIDPLVAMVCRHGLPALPAGEHLRAYVDPDRLPDVTSRDDLWKTIDVLVLGHWLQFATSP